MLRRLFADPLTVKELSGVSRRWQTYFARVVYVGLTAFVLYQVWANLDARSRVLSPSEYAGFGRDLFLVVMSLQLLFAALSGISAASDMITRERRSGTLGLLALTPLTPWRIVAGKWKAAVAMAGSIVLCGTPVLAVCVYLGGAGIWELAWSLSVSAAVAALCSALSLFYSSVFRAGFMAIILSFVTLFVYTLLPVFILVGTRGDESTLQFFAHVHPAYAAVGAAEPRLSSEYGWISATLLSFGMAFLLLLGTASRVSTLITSVLGPSLLVRTFEAMDRFYEGLGPRPIRNVRVLSGRGGVWERRALLWKELHTRASGKLRYATRIGLGLLLFVLLPLSVLVTGGRAWQVPMLWFSSALLLLMATASGASLFVKEKEERKWDVLLSTPLTPWDIIGSKLLAGAVGLIPLGVILLLFFTLLSRAYGVGLDGWLSTAGAVGLSVAFAYVLGAAASLRAQTLRGAFSFTFGALCFLLLLLPLFMAFLDSLPGVNWRSERFPFLLVTLSNPGVFLTPFSEAAFGSTYSWRTERAREEYARLFPFFVGYSVFYSAAISLLILRMRARFNPVTGRG
jgi:ABC-type transport system involved in multi-copper enzyme maturation permease subunit